MNGILAPISFVSSMQINCILPSPTPPGTIYLEVATPLGGMSPAVTVSRVAPALFGIEGTTYAAAVFNELPIVYVGPPGEIPGATAPPAKAGDYVQLYGTGMGPTSPRLRTALFFKSLLLLGKPG